MFEIGTATGYIDLIEKLNTFLTAKGSAFGLFYVGTGDGTLTDYSGGATSVAETYTITAINATTFDVVGSVSGDIGDATVGTPFSHAKLEITINAGATAFVAGDEFTLSTAPPWTASLSPVSATSTKWRIQILDTTLSNIEIGRFEMMLTPGGADQIAGSGGTASASSENGSNVAANAADTDDATRWIATGKSGWWEFEFLATKAIQEIAIKRSTSSTSSNPLPKDLTVEYFDGSAWKIVGSFREETSWGTNERRVYRLSPYIWKAPGNDGTSEIYVGIHPYENAGTGWFNWRLNGFTAFDAGVDWFSQPGAISTVEPFGPILPLSSGSIGYWFVANGRRVIIVAKVGAVYGAAYLGLIQPYASPGQWPLPLFVGGSLWFNDEPASTSTDHLVGSAHDRHTMFPLSFLPLIGGAPDLLRFSSARLRKPDGSWLGFSARSGFYDPKEDFVGTTWPYAYGFTNLKPDLDGAYSLFPVILLERGPDNIYGQLDGVHAVTGSGISAEADITVDPHKYVAFPDVTRSTAADFCAVKLD